MKLVRFGKNNQEKPGCIDKNGKIRDLSGIIQDGLSNVVNPFQLSKLLKLNLESLPIVDETVRLGPCVANVGKFICIGLNYRDHAQEMGAPIPEKPVIFLKANSAICGAYDPVILPRGSVKTDWEVELGVVIGTQGKYITEANALNHIAGYCVVTDFSERAFQKDESGQWTKGKACDTFGPLGPWLVTCDEIPDPQRLRLWTEVDGHRFQDGNTADMIFTVAQIISYASQFFTLHPGDVISTGTPAGVGMRQQPQPQFLRAGQVIEVGVEGLGQQRHTVIQDL